MIITCNTFDFITWTRFLRFDLKQLAVFKIQISAVAEYIPYFTSLLSTSEIARAERYHKKSDQHRFVTSRAVARIILGKYTNQDPTSVRFSVGRHYRPFLADAAGLQYNVSHAKDYLVLAVSAREIGIDIEQVDPAFPSQDIVAQSFSLSEQASIEKQESASNYLFYQSWTRKEAFVKATGQGIDANFHRIPSLDGQHRLPGTTGTSTQGWIVSSFTVSADYIAAIAYPATDLRTNKAFYCVDTSLWA